MRVLCTWWAKTSKCVSLSLSPFSSSRVSTQCKIITLSIKLNSYLQRLGPISPLFWSPPSRPLILIPIVLHSFCDARTLDGRNGFCVCLGPGLRICLPMQLQCNWIWHLFSNIILVTNRRGHFILYFGTVSEFTTTLCPRTNRQTHTPTAC